ncbi:hypothetical protein PFICI_08874 [Pestalotiopsis fici W106-1]|uniref:Aminoglycoside phosphotransferase domain-containing protein n=1 Tax=Pestalotiopsis fici (strain W106-1 / CGMCC3.15140) TaxID=1229662 RepID=W3X1H5_PESFW|nr:uncharacterized protein PFICI_08874 [Pestalotiopsis fici W106-1]ETS79021.1 hypothetical protein PFICI_08874 [Pestalotiopsis fici W106-1]
MQKRKAGEMLLPQSGPPPGLVPIGSDIWAINKTSRNVVKEEVLARVNWHAVETIYPPGGPKFVQYLGNAYLGGYYLIRRLVLDDGTSIVVKIPRFDRRDIDWIMMTEVSTMKYLKERSSIPVPKLHAWHFTSQNKVGAPYMIMEYIHSTNAQEMQRLLMQRVLRGHLTNFELGELNTSFRQQMATIQAWFGYCNFPRIGSLYMNSESSEWMVGPEASSGKGPWAREEDYADELLDRMAAAQSGEDNLAICETDKEALRKLVSSAHSKRRVLRLCDERFQLTIPNFGPKDILVNGNLKILGLVGLDRVMALPRGMAGQFPFFCEMDRHIKNTYELTFMSIIGKSEGAEWPLQANINAIRQQGQYREVMNNRELMLMPQEAASLWLGTVKAAVCQGLLQFNQPRLGIIQFSGTRTTELKKWHKIILDLLRKFGDAPETSLDLAAEIAPFDLS